jgi:DNA-binding SARP family transcriptional activator
MNTSIGLCLLNGPHALINGRHHALPEGSKRLVVLVAIQRCVSRQTAGERLWPDVDAQRSAGNLRSAVWRLRCAELPLLAISNDVLRLAPHILLDIDVLYRLTMESADSRSQTNQDRLLGAATEALDLLPGWYEEWVCLERERLRTSMLDAIDGIAIRLRRSGQCAAAIDAAVVAVAADPLRETSQAALISAHLAEGNLCEARRAYGAYRRVLLDELGIEPSPYLTRLVGIGVRPQSPPPTRRAGEWRGASTMA